MHFQGLVVGLGFGSPYLTPSPVEGSPVELECDARRYNGLGPLKMFAPLSDPRGRAAQQWQAARLATPAGLAGYLGLPYSYSNACEVDLGGASCMHVPAPFITVVTEYNLIEHCGPAKLSWHA